MFSKVNAGHEIGATEEDAGLMSGGDEALSLEIHNSQRDKGETAQLHLKYHKTEFQPKNRTNPARADLIKQTS